MYSKRVRYYILHPVNGPVSFGYNCKASKKTTVACRTNPKRKTTNQVTFMLCVENGSILEARWEVFGDPVAIAVACWCVEQVRGKSIDELVHTITPELAALYLNIDDPLDIRGGCQAALAALTAALASYSP